MTPISKIASDFQGLAKVCGLLIATRWLLAVIITIPQILQTKNLQPADKLLGIGPFKIKHNSIKNEFWVTSESSVSGIREMYVRDCYLEYGKLLLNDGDQVLDLGANIGNFTALALAHGPNIKVISVEPNNSFNKAFKRSIDLNPGFLERVTLVRGFIGSEIDLDRLNLAEDPDYSDAPFITEAELIGLCPSENIDFLKCDIEGGEFALLKPGSLILQRCRAIAIEIHSFAGDVNGFVNMLAAEGFDIVKRTVASDGTAIVLARRP
ncbi:MAG: FkbM family methyltransferase [Pseudomonadota bacterium]